MASCEKSDRCSAADPALVQQEWRDGLDNKACNAKAVSCPVEAGEGLQSTLSKTPYSDSHENILWHRLEADETKERFDVWLELLNTRRRKHGIQGIKSVWAAVLKRDVNLPTTGELADALWTHFLALGFGNSNVLKNIFIYAKKQKDTHDRTWPKLYKTVLCHQVQSRRSDILWKSHSLLWKDFPPTSQQFLKFLSLALPHERLRQICLKIHQSFPMIRLYDFAIAELCKHGLYATAVEWHEQLIRRGDFPSDARKAEPVLRYLAVHDDETRLKECTRMLVEAGVSFAAYRDKDVKIPSFISRDVMMPRREGSDKGSEQKVSDGFCARLFATKVFSIDTIINSLVFLGAKQIGPQALREMAARELHCKPYHRAIQARLEQLEANGISTGNSTFTTVVRRFTTEEDDHLLRNIISCDLHSDTFEDLDLQESFLPYYQEQHDDTALARTIATLTAKLPEQLVEERRLNWILRSCFTRRDLPVITRTIEQMQLLHVQIESKTAVRMRHSLLSPRKPGHRPLGTEELDILIRVSQSVLLSGGFLPPKHWSETLRRLGMSGQLLAFKNLALWLAKWYSSPEYRASQLSTPGTTALVHHPLLSADLKPSDPFHPLRALFPPSLQQGIIAWGFQHTGLSHHKPRGKSNWTWGICLLRTLRKVHNVHISTNVVAKALKIRLLLLLSPVGRSRRKINNVRRRDASGRVLGADDVGLVITKAEKIWGKKLLERPVDLDVRQERQRIAVVEATLNVLLDGLPTATMQSFPTLHRISPTALSSHLLSPTSARTFAIIDVRDDDHAGGHIRSSIHVPSSTLDHRLPELVRTLKGKEKVVFHCALSQQRGPGAALRYMKERGRLLGTKGEDGGVKVEQKVAKEGMSDEQRDEEGVVEIEEEEGGDNGKEQEVFVLDGGFVKWQERFGRDERLTEEYAADIWVDEGK
ncbi:MAG: hypothetical protein L6R35_002139 [Caloplaca aegaea]|nr:MAG: hypothetical protein L6R35_002139 [Caloplaca aegaea]